MGKGGQSTAPNYPPQGVFLPAEAKKLPKSKDDKSPGEQLLLWSVWGSIMAVPLVNWLLAFPVWTLPFAWAVLAEALASLPGIWSPTKKTCAKTSKRAPREKSGKFTWEEVASHNTEDDCWVSVEGRVYDITEWVPNHPGGKQYLVLAAGRDVTDLMRSYHPFTQKPFDILSKFEIGVVSSYEHPVYKPDSGFYRDCCQQVANYFLKTGKDSKAIMPGLIRMLCVFVVAMATYYACHWLHLPLLVKLMCAAIFGACQALPLLHIMHDASHTAVGHSERWWINVGRIAMDWYAGASLTSWHNQHVIGHHIYTNVMGCDPDLPVELDGDLRRIVPKQVYQKMYRFQHIYMPVLYGLLGLKFRVQDLTDTLGSEMNGPIRVNAISHRVWLRQFGTKMFFLFWRVAVPLAVTDISLAQWLLLFLVSEFATGYYLAYNFQVSHVSEDADWPERNVVINDEWAISQVKSSIDYSHGNAATAFLSGALNYQTVHHLFPCVSQYHYPAIAPIVMDTCRKYGIKYNVLPSFASAFWMHIKHLKDMGESPKKAL